MTKIVGLLIARDEEITIGLMLDTVHTLVDEIVFIDNMSKDRTAEIVRERCKLYDIPLIEGTIGLEGKHEDQRRAAYNIGLTRNADWFFILDGDMVFNHPEQVRELAEKGEYDQFWFVTINLYGDKETSCGVNEPHPWLIRNKPGIQSGWTYYSSWPKDPNTDRFLGWNLNGFKTYDHLFWRFQLVPSTQWNEIHKTNLGIEGFMKAFFIGEPSEDYKKRFILNRIRWLAYPISTVCQWYTMSEEDFRKKYMQFPQIFKDWPEPFKLIRDETGKVCAREPDLVGVPVCANEEVTQLDPSFIYNHSIKV